MVKKSIIAFLSITLISIMVFAATKDKGNVVATYSGGRKVTEEDIMKTFSADLENSPLTKGKKFSELDKNIKEYLINNYVKDKLLLKEASKQGVEKTKSYKKMLKIAKEKILFQELLEKHLKKAITDKEVREEYDRYVKKYEGQKEVDTSHILVKTEEEAKEIRKKVNKKGSNFVDLVVKYSQDEKSNNKEIGGNFGYRLKEYFVKPYGDKAFSMKTGEVSEPVKTEFGYHIIKKNGERKHNIYSYEEGKDFLKARLRQVETQKYIKSLLEKAKIEMKF
ncbi:MAG: peptidylprolyl isomerase [Rickettsiaceae bacterium]|nr:peptidylprolyl isomerase [Rickettsiaceae bacterium]